ncbi:hypothetical protein BraRD5C2_33210 [Bradyrhizobium sp. RD5-C2]|nr:hypothetical protein BraRD5C2_33210 [Bradyrhizobium sp. RD5-C2]
MLTHFEPLSLPYGRGHEHLSEHLAEQLGTTMADRSALKLVGIIFATVTVVVMVATGMVVKGFADGNYSFETTASIDR